MDGDGGEDTEEKLREEKRRQKLKEKNALMLKLQNYHVCGTLFYFLAMFQVVSRRVCLSLCVCV